jgi:3-oxoacyl-[acyl-carrier protein] reductase
MKINKKIVIIILSIIVIMAVISGVIYFVNQSNNNKDNVTSQEQMANVAMKMLGITYEEARAQQIASIKAGRLGRPDEFGDAFAFLCAAQAGYISGQNLQLDGGSYEGVF